MIERPELSDETIRAALEENWGICVSDITFLPIGNESETWVFRAGASFLKIKNKPIDPVTVVIPSELRKGGIVQVVSPLPDQQGELFSRLENFQLILYPYIHGRTGMEAGLSDAQWIQLGMALRQIHQARLPGEVAAKVALETFVPKWAAMVRRLDGMIAQGGFAEPSQVALAEFWTQRREVILAITNRCEELGRMAAARNAPNVLCHADIHLANVLVDDAGGLHIVDWDQPIYAPVERDLMFLTEETGRGLIRQPREEALFLQGYGPAGIDRVIMAYYRYEWAVQEFGDYGERVFLLPEAGGATRAASVQGFIELFHPGDVVESALSWEKVL